MLRDLDGLPIVAPGALLSVARWHELQAAIAALSHGRTPPRPWRPYPLLHGLARDTVGHLMYQHHTADHAPRYVCRMLGCPVNTAINMVPLDAHVEVAWLADAGDDPEVEPYVVSPAPDRGRLAAIVREIDATMAALSSTRDADDIARLAGRLGALRTAQTAAEDEESGHGGITGWRSTGRTLADAYGAADLDGRRSLLAARVEAVVVAPGRQGGRQRSVEQRAEIVWHDDAALDGAVAVDPARQG